MWEVIAAFVLMLIILLGLVSIAFLPGRTPAEEYEHIEELRKARAELLDMLIRELRLNEICQWLTDFIAGSQSAMESSMTFSKEKNEYPASKRQRHRP